MPERTVAVAVTAEMSNYLAGMSRGSAATSALGKQAQTTGQATQAFVSKIGGSISSLGNQVGGTVGLLLNSVGGGIEKIAASSAHLSTALTVGGGAAVAAGIGLQQLGSGAVQATDQLNAAVTASGDSVSDYSEKIDRAVASNENLGFASEDTKQALTTLIPAAGSTQAALNQMSVVANLAAAKHEDLASAATAVARVLGGNGSRTLSVYGIQMDGVGTKAQQGARALDELDQKLNGQASAAVNNFSGQVGVLTTHLTDFVKDAAGPAGIAFQVVGGAAAATGLILDIYKLRVAQAASAQTALAASAAAAAPAVTAEGAAADTASVGVGGMAAASTALKAGLVGVAIVAGGTILANLLELGDAAKNNAAQFDAATASAASFNKEAASGTLLGTAGSSASNRNQLLSATTRGAGSEGAFNASNLGFIGDISNSVDGYTAAATAVSAIDSKLATLVGNGHAKEAAQQFDLWKDAAKNDKLSLDELDQKFPAYSSALQNYSDTTGAVTKSTVLMGSQFSVAAQNAANLKVTTDDLETSLKDYGSSAQTTETATENYYAALDAANAAIKTNGKDIDDSTAKGRANQSALYDLATNVNNLTAAQLKAKTPIDQVRASVDAQTQSFIATAEKMGYTQAAAQALAAQLITTATTKYNFTLDGITVATNSIDTYIAELLKIPQTIQTNVKILTNGGKAVTIYTASENSRGGLLDKYGQGHFAAGGGYGLYRGAGTGTSDSIPAMVSAGEYINTAKTVSRVGASYFDYLNRGGSPKITIQQTPSQKQPAGVSIGQIVQQPSQSSAEFAQTLGFYLAQVS